MPLIVRWFGAAVCKFAYLATGDHEDSSSSSSRNRFVLAPLSRGKPHRGLPAAAVGARLDGRKRMEAFLLLWASQRATRRPGVKPYITLYRNRLWVIIELSYCIAATHSEALVLCDHKKSLLLIPPYKNESLSHRAAATLMAAAERASTCDWRWPNDENDVIHVLEPITGRRRNLACS